MEQSLGCLYCARDIEIDPDGKPTKFCSANCFNLYYREKKARRKKVDDQKLSHLIEDHEKDISYMKKTYLVRELDDDPKRGEFFENLKRKTKILVLVCARCKCERCETEEELTIHHLITRRVKGFIDFNRYLTQRYYYKNIALLCVACHTKFHSEEKTWDEKLEPLSQELIADVKRRYFVNE